MRMIGPITSVLACLNCIFAVVMALDDNGPALFLYVNSLVFAINNILQSFILRKGYKITAVIVGVFVLTVGIWFLVLWLYDSLRRF